MESFGATCMVEESDNALVTAAKGGESHAFEKLVVRHKGRVLAMAQRITNNREDAEDVVQECFHKAFLHLGNFEGKAQFPTWLTRIAVNEALMLLRRRRRALEVFPGSPDDDAQSGWEAFVDHSPSPEESCWRRERRDLLTAAINRLAPTLRRTVLLRDIEERSVRETAQTLGISISAVKARLFHGRRKLYRTVRPGRKLHRRSASGAALLSWLGRGASLPARNLGGNLQSDAFSPS